MRFSVICALILLIWPLILIQCDVLFAINKYRKQVFQFSNELSLLIYYPGVELAKRTNKRTNEKYFIWKQSTTSVEYWIQRPKTITTEKKENKIPWHLKWASREYMPSVFRKCVLHNIRVLLFFVCVSVLTVIHLILSFEYNKKNNKKKQQQQKSECKRMRRAECDANKCDKRLFPYYFVSEWAKMGRLLLRQQNPK